MEVITEANIHDFIRQYSGTTNFSSDSDIFAELEITGDDFDDFIQEFQRKFDVDMSSYLWYFHSDEEGISVFGSIFKPSHKRVDRIPVSPKMLLDFANRKKWDLIYPEHSLPKRRYDLILGSMILFCGLIALIIYLFRN
jgi:hypothetical protein